MKVVYFPRIYIPDNLRLPSEQELESMRKPLQFCSTCHYVLCSCGNCHNSELCNEICLHGVQQEGGQADG